MENGSDVPVSSECIEDLALIENETFDFDLSLSPQECPLIELDEDMDENEEDEVFIGPVGFKEQCVATNAELTIAERKSMSPPSVAQYASIFQEALKVAQEFAEKTSKSGSSSSSSTSSCSNTNPSETGSSGSESRPASDLDSVREDDVDAKSNVTEKKIESSVGKSEAQSFKREVKRDMRSTLRRNTVVIASNQLNPYPTKSPSPLKHNPVVERKPPLTKLHQPRPPQHVAPANGRGSMLPTRGLRRPAPVSRGRISGNHSDGVGSKNGNASFDGRVPVSGLRKPAVKRLASPKASGLRKPGFSRDNGSKIPTNNSTTEVKTDKSGLKAPSKKPSLIKPSAISRPGQKNGGAGNSHAPGPSKLQPMKATMAFGAGSAAPAGSGGGATKKTTPPTQASATIAKRKMITPRAVTPCTPVCQEKKVIPKRILAGGSGATATPNRGIATPRRSSIACIPRPSTPTQPSTPHTRHASITNPPVSAGPSSVRRRSGIPTTTSIPTPNRRTSTPSRRPSTPSVRPSTPSARTGSKIGSVSARPQSARPAQNENPRFSPLFLSPLTTPPQFQLSPDSPVEEVKKRDDVSPSGSSPDCTSTTTTATKTPTPANVLRSRTNVQEPAKESTTVKATTPKDVPALGVLIDFGSATPKDAKSVKRPQQLGQTENKENLIDF